MFDTIVVVVSVFTFALILGIIGFAFNSVDTAINGIDPSTPGYSEATTITGNLNNDFGPTIDWILLCIAFGLPLISAVLAWSNNIPNIFFFLSIGLLFLLVFIGWGLQWGAEGIFVSGNALGTYIASVMPGTYWILSHFGLYSMLVFLIVGIGTYVRVGRGGGFSYGF